MQVLVLKQDVRIRAGQGTAVFYDPINEAFVDNGVHTESTEDGGSKGTWVHLDEGTQLMVVMAYEKGSTYGLIVNEREDSLKDDRTYGMVVRQLSMEKILEAACILDEVVKQPKVRKPEVKEVQATHPLGRFRSAA